MKQKAFTFLAGLLTAGLLAFTASTHTADPADKSLARVDKKSGKLVFMECEPVGEYSVAFTFTTRLGSASQPGDFTNAALKQAMKTSEKDGKEFDGIVIKSGEREEVAIKFK